MVMFFIVVLFARTFIWPTVRAALTASHRKSLSVCQTFSR